MPLTNQPCPVPELEAQTDTPHSQKLHVYDRHGLTSSHRLRVTNEHDEDLFSFDRESVFGPKQLKNVHEDVTIGRIQQKTFSAHRHCYLLNEADKVVGCGRIAKIRTDEPYFYFWLLHSPVDRKEADKALNFEEAPPHVTVEGDWRYRNVVWRNAVDEVFCITLQPKINQEYYEIHIAPGVDASKILLMIIALNCIFPDDSMIPGAPLTTIYDRPKEESAQ